MPKQWARRAKTAQPEIKAVFISSTYRDLAVHRQAVWEEIRRFKVTVRGMEEFGARTASALETCLAEVDQSQVYVGIIGFRIGSIDQKSGKSFTQLEYERAQQQKQITLIYLADEELAVIPYKDIDKDSASQEKLAAFKKALREQHTVVTFSSPEDLAAKIRTDFAKILAPRKEPKVTAPSEYDQTAVTLKRFLLVPKTVQGREVRVKVRFITDPYPASREICKAFNLEYGLTVGAQVRVDLPNDDDAKRFRQLYSTAQRLDEFMSLARGRSEVELYVRLQFTETDVAREQAEFLGTTYYDNFVDDGDPNETYVPPQGKMILLFAKVAPPAT